MKNYNVPAAQNIYLQMLSQQTTPLSEAQEAVLFAKALQYQDIYYPNSVYFCSDNEFYVSPNPNGYAVTGYYDTMYQNGTSQRTPFSVTVRKTNGYWYPVKNYVGADTKTGSNFIITWILLMLGCTLVGLISYFALTAAIGI